MINCFDRLKLSLRLLLFGGLLEHEAHDSGNHAEYRAYHKIHVKEAGAQNGHAGKYYAHDKKYFFRHFIILQIGVLFSPLVKVFLLSADNIAFLGISVK